MTLALTHYQDTTTLSPSFFEIERKLGVRITYQITGGELF